MLTEIYLRDAFARAIAPSTLHAPLRVGINYGNYVLAQKDAGGQPSGITADLSHALAEHVGRQLEFVVFGTAREVAEAVKDARVDMAFVANDPERANDMDFTTSYLTLEGAYMVPPNSVIHSMKEVDKPGNRVVVAKGTAYEKHLSRTLKHAGLVFTGKSSEVVPHCMDQQYEVASGVRQQLEADQVKWPGSQILPGSFMEIHQAICVPKDRPAALGFLDSFIREKIRSGFVAESLHRHGFGSATDPLAARTHIAPTASPCI